MRRTLRRHDLQPKRAGIPQYIDNRRVYGCLTLHDDQPAIVAGQLAALANGPVKTAAMMRCRFELSAVSGPRDA